MAGRTQRKEGSWHCLCFRAFRVSKTCRKFSRQIAACQQYAEETDIQRERGREGGREREREREFIGANSITGSPSFSSSSAPAELVSGFLLWPDNQKCQIRYHLIQDTVTVINTRTTAGCWATPWAF
jgi:hypothetical protein